MVVLHFSIDARPIEACGAYIKYEKILPLQRLLRKYYPNFSHKKNIVNKKVSSSSSRYGKHIYCLREILSTGSYDFKDNKAGTCEKILHLLQLTHNLPINLNIINFYDIDELLDATTISYNFGIILLRLEFSSSYNNNINIKQTFTNTKLSFMKYIFENLSEADFCTIMSDNAISHNDKVYIIDQVKIIRNQNDNMTIRNFNIVTSDKKVIDIKTNLKQILLHYPINSHCSINFNDWKYTIGLLQRVINNSDENYEALKILFRLRYFIVQNLNEIIKDYFVNTIENGNYQFTYSMILNSIKKLYEQLRHEYFKCGVFTENKEFLTAVIIAVNRKNDNFMVNLTQLIKHLPTDKIGIYIYITHYARWETKVTLDKIIKTFKELYKCNAYDSSEFEMCGVIRDVFNSIMPNGKLTKAAIKH